MLHLRPCLAQVFRIIITLMQDFVFESILLTALHDFGAAILQIMYAIHDCPSSTPSAIRLRPDASTCGRGRSWLRRVDDRRRKMLLLNHFKKFARRAHFFKYCRGGSGGAEPSSGISEFFFEMMSVPCTRPDNSRALPPRRPCLALVPCPQFTPTSPLMAERSSQ